MTPRNTLAIVAALFLASACSDDKSEGGEGTLNITAYGEDFIELGIPADEMADGWSVNFDTFVVTIDAVNVANKSFPVSEPVDISVPTEGAGHRISSGVAPVGAHANSSFSITHVELAGSAVKDADTKTFNWTFENATNYTACETTTKVTDGGEATFQITVHADHFFYDSLVAEEPQVVFQALADADTDLDGFITKTELESTDIGSYDPGNDNTVDNLWTWLIAQSRTLGHVDGEGHCEATAAD